MNPLQRLERIHTIKIRFLINEWPSVLRRDPCVYCHDTAPTLDHIVPLARNGSNHWTNLAPACGSCNQAKGHTDLLMFLIGVRDTTQVHEPQLRVLQEEKVPPMLTYNLSELHPDWEKQDLQTREF